jgi:putative addiction module component (TIGR02574 family)
MREERLFGALSTEPWRYRRRRDRGIIPFIATPAAAKVIAEALALSDEERAAVAEELLASLDSTQPDDSSEAVTACKTELDRRWAAYQFGEEPGIPWPEVRARLRARLNRG